MWPTVSEYARSRYETVRVSLPLPQKVPVCVYNIRLAQFMLHERHDVRQIGLARILPVHDRSRAHRHRGGGKTMKESVRDGGKLVAGVEEGRGEKRPGSTR